MEEEGERSDRRGSDSLGTSALPGAGEDKPTRRSNIPLAIRAMQGLPDGDSGHERHHISRSIKTEH